MSLVQQATSERSSRIVILFSVLVGGLWLAMTIYFLVDSKKTTTAGKSAVAIHATSPVATGSTPAATYKAPRVAATPLVHHSTSATPSWSFVQKTTPMTSTSFRLHETSSATTQNIGGGGNGTGIATTSGHGTSGRGISYGGNMLALAATTPLAVPGAGNATSIASTTEAPRDGGPSVRKVDGPPQIPFPDPIGETPWIMMALLTIGWCVRRRLKKQ